MHKSWVLPNLVTVVDSLFIFMKGTISTANQCLVAGSNIYHHDIHTIGPQNHEK